MSDQGTRANPGQTRGPNRYESVSEEQTPTEPNVPEAEPRVLITLGVADGFRFGCGMLLAGIAFYAGLLVLGGFALLLAAILGIALPFGLGGR